MKKIKRIVLKVSAGLLCLLMVLSLLPDSSVFAEDQSFVYDLEQQIPEGMEEDTTNPTNTQKEQSVMLSTQEELLLYASAKTGNSEATQNTYYLTQNIDADTPADGIKSSPLSQNSVMSDHVSYVTAVAFDAEGSGRNAYVAYVGVKRYSDGHNWIVMWAQNTADNSRSSLQQIAWADWLAYNSDSMTQALARNFFSITAGDYDDDGVDTVVINVPDDNSTNASVREFSYSSGKFTELKNIEYGYLSYSNYSTTSSTGNRDRLNISLSTGDYNGDDIDELAVAASCNERTDNKTENLNQYSTILTLWGRGSNGWGRQSIHELMTQTGDSSYNLLLEGSIASGDINNDNIDEIVAAGYLNSASLENGKIANKFVRSDSKLAMQSVSWDGKNYVKSNLASVDMNNLTANTVKYHDYQNASYVWTLPAVACAAINGQAAAEAVFVEGTVYDYSTPNPSEPYTADDIENSSVSGILAGTVTGYIGSVTGACYNHDNAGREQFVYTTLLKKQNDNQYMSGLGYIKGAGYADTTGTDGKTVYGSAQTYSSKSQTVVDSWSNDNMYAQDDQNSHVGLNCLVVAVDCDNDGVRARYSKKGYTYTDPEVIAGLQAAPYFSQLGDYNDFNDGSTSYTVTTSYSTSSRKSDNVSVGAGFASEAQLAVGPKIAIEAGYSFEYSKTFENSITTSYTDTFTAGAYNTVIMQRIPVVNYFYAKNVKASWTAPAREIARCCSVGHAAVE